MTDHPRSIMSTGVAERFDGPVDRVPPYDPVKREHLWTTLVMYRVDLGKLESGEAMLYDSANLLMAGTGVGCFYCEQLYVKRLAFRPCPGDPS